MTAPAHRPRRWLHRLALVCGGVLLALVVAEGVLQVARLTLRDRFRLPAPAGTAGEHSVLCIGDSHTYGLGAHPLQSYPARLEGRLNGWDSKRPIRVENYGFPGVNTSQAFHWLRYALDARRPDLVVLLAGFNNHWNPSTPADLAAPGVPSSGPTLLLPRFLKLLLFNLKAGPAPQLERRGNDLLIVAPDGTAQTINADREARENLLVAKELAEAVRDDLLRMVEYCQQRGIEVVLQTYAYDAREHFRMANAGIRQAADRSGTALVDQAEWFREQDVNPLKAFQLDGHPTGYGYDQMALALHEAFAADPRFQAWNLAPVGTNRYRGPAPGDEAALSLEPGPREDGEPSSISLRGPAGGFWLLGAARSRAAQPLPNGVALPPADPLFSRAFRGEIGLSGRFDAEGRAEARLHPDLLELLEGREGFLQLLLLNPHAPDEEHFVLGASPVVVLPGKGNG